MGDLQRKEWVWSHVSVCQEPYVCGKSVQTTGEVMIRALMTEWKKPVCTC